MGKTLTKWWPPNPPKIMNVKKAQVDKETTW